MVDIIVSSTAVGSFGAHSVGIVSVCPGGAATGHFGKFSSLFPCISPGSIRKWISDGIIGDICSIVIGKQISPVG